MMEYLNYLCWFASGVLIASYGSNSEWRRKAKSITRKECYGRLYWVIEDGDLAKLQHVNEWHKHAKAGDK